MAPDRTQTGAGPAETRPTTVVLETAAGQIRISAAPGGDWSVGVRAGIREPWRSVCGGHDLSQVWVVRAPDGIEPPVVVGERLAIDPPRRQVLVDGRQLGLRPKEFDLLAALARRPDRVISKAELLEEVWGFRPRDRGDEHRVNTTMVSLRVALSTLQAGDLIRTVRGVGFELPSGSPASGSGGPGDD
jgi:DNA-binding winged helix-turn-helix (wHTH) protein